MLSVHSQPLSSCSATGLSTPDAALPTKMSTEPNASAAVCNQPLHPFDLADVRLDDDGLGAPRLDLAAVSSACALWRK